MRTFFLLALLFWYQLALGKPIEYVMEVSALNSDVLYIHFINKKLIVDLKDNNNELVPEEEKKFLRSLLSTPGVKNIHFDRYTLTVVKNDRIKWKQVTPSVLKLCEARLGKLKKVKRP